ncbi:3-oxoacyl-(acyl-carrier-protein) reductase (chromatophore) [Paulinella micropora]|uniref:3-oxoacyl-[acyl-carrier-protein] reductase n=1 Tax=Paulinella micropora TaxID=1928728 RepID=A0A1S6YIY4_9EUKA|nr:3-oxoacyl-(acyl-carrier-protein) reductase [Paulinella micropora]BBL86484.1 3-oxoacyl-(acyl-carrier-protein) reductase [Paulinella micropora]
MINTNSHMNNLSLDILSGQTILVTGSSRGIGRAIALELAIFGAEVVVNYMHSRNDADEIVAAIHGIGGKAYALQANVAVEQEVENLITTIVNRSGHIDVLVNNAGITHDKLLVRMKTDEWQSVIDLNLSGVFFCTRAAGRFMLKRRKGRIVNITSVVGLTGNVGQANYAAAKAGVIGLTRSAAKEFASRGITVNAVAPGFIKTDMTQNLNLSNVQTAIPLGILGNPEHIAGAVRFLASDYAASYITGQVLRVDGGLSMG